MESERLGRSPKATQLKGVCDFKLTDRYPAPLVEVLLYLSTRRVLSPHRLTSTVWPGSLCGYICWLLGQKTARFCSLITCPHFLLLSSPAYSRPRYAMPSLQAGTTVLSSFYPTWALTLWPQSCLGKLLNCWDETLDSGVCFLGEDLWRQTHPTHLVLSLLMCFIFLGLPGPHSRLGSFLSRVTLNLALSSASPKVQRGSHWYPHSVTSLARYSLFGCLHKIFHVFRMSRCPLCLSGGLVLLLM